MRALLLAEHHAGRLDPQTAQALTAALQLGGTVEILVAGDGVAGVAAEVAQLFSVSRVRVADDPRLAHQAAEPLAALLRSLAERYDAFLAPASTTGKEVMPRLAALLDVAQVSGIVAVEAANRFRRPIYAGALFETVEMPPGRMVVTVRASAFAAAATGGSAEIVAVPLPELPDFGSVIGESRVVSDRPDLASARIVVSGGKGLGSKDNFNHIIMPLAEKLHAAIGASRAAVDAGYATNELQVGQTGRVVSPALYIAIGISGAIQHLAGMKDSGVIVAINADPAAPIFAVTDFGLVGDLFELVPALVEALG